MTRDDIIRWAKEAGWKRVGHNPDTGPAFPVLIGNLERFAALVAAQETEACVRACESVVVYYSKQGKPKATDIAWECVDAIRARGK